MIIIYLIAFCLVLISVLVITSIPSIINIFKLGYKEYFERFKLLLSLYNKLNVSFFIKQNKKYSYCYNNSTAKIVNRIEHEYYFPIYKSYTNLILVRRGEYRIHIQECIEINNKWESKGREIEFELCIFGKMLHDLFQKKVEKLSKNAIEISNMDELENYLNSELISIKRETKLKNLLNG